MKIFRYLIPLLFTIPAGATVITQNITVTFTCTGTVGPFPFNYSVSGANALTVKKNGVTLTTPAQYTVTPVNNNYDNGGSVRLVTSCPSGQSLVITRTTPLTQATVFTDNMPTPMKAIENGLDKLTEIAQELNASKSAVTSVLPGTSNVHVSPSDGKGDVLVSVDGSAGNPSGPNGARQYDNNDVFGGVAADLQADALPGADIGAKINAAFLSATGSIGTPATGVVVNLAPNGAYSYTTTIRIPNNVSSPYILYPVLDCHGSSLTYTGSGEGLTIMGENSYKSGEMRNCNVVFSNPSATATLWSRIDFKMTHNLFSLGTTGITLNNDTVHGGPGYTEQQHWSDIEVTVPNNGCGLTLTNSATGTGSFFYNWMEGFHFSLGASSKGLCVNNGAVNTALYGGNFQFHVNSTSTGSKLIDIAQSASFSRGTVDISGENTGGGTQYDIFSEGSAATFYNWGKSYATGFVHGYAAGVPESNVSWISGPHPISDDLGGGYGTSTLTSEPGSINAARQCKNIQLSTASGILLASDGGAENDCYWMVGSRYTTDPIPDVDISGPTLALTSAAASGGGSQVITGTITGGGSNALAGYTAQISGFVNAANNGIFSITASTTTTLTIASTTGVSETHAATVIVSQHPIASRIYADALGNIGFGSGFSFIPHVVSGVDISKPNPVIALPEFRLGLNVRDPQAANTVLADGGANMLRRADHTTGDIIDYILSGPVAGQPSNHYKLMFRDYVTLGDVTAMDCRANTLPTCTFQKFVANVSATLSYITGSTQCLHVDTTGLISGTGSDCGAGGSGNTTSTALTTNKIPKASGANSIIDSSISDNGTTVSTPEPISAPSFISGTPSAGALAALPAGASGSACDETVTAGVPAAGVDYIRCDATTHTIVKSLNGGPEVALGGPYPWSCQPGLGDGVNAITTTSYPQSTCYNDTGKTITLTGIKCFSDNNGASTLAATNGAGTALLTGAVTCTNAFAAGTQSATVTIAAGDFIKFTFAEDGTTKQTTAVVTGTRP